MSNYLSRLLSLFASRTAIVPESGKKNNNIGQIVDVVAVAAISCAGIVIPILQNYSVLHLSTPQLLDSDIGLMAVLFGSWGITRYEITSNTKKNEDSYRVITNHLEDLGQYSGLSPASTARIREFARVESELSETIRRSGRKSHFPSICAALQRELDSEITALAGWQCDVDIDISPWYHAQISRHLKQRFDAVSYGQLDYWVTPAAAEYLRHQAKAATTGRSINRIFIVRRDELEQKKQQLIDILEAHERGRLGFAIAVFDYFEDNTTALIDGSVQYDLGLYDRNEALSHFVGSGPDRFHVWFRNDDPDSKNNSFIDAHINLFLNLLYETQLVNKTFANQYMDALNEAQFNQLQQMNKRYVEIRSSQGETTTFADNEHVFQIIIDSHVRNCRDVIAEGLAKLYNLTDPALPPPVVQ